MWTPLKISIAICIITVVLIALLEKKGVLKQNSKPYIIIAILGGYIPIAVICGNYAYVETDTLNDTMIVAFGMYLCIALWMLFLSKWKATKYNFIVFTIIAFCSYFIFYNINKYMLTNMQIGILSSFLGAIFGNSIVRNKYKWRLIITGIVVILMIIILPGKYPKYLVSKNKVENVSVKYVESMGYDINSNDWIHIYSDKTRYNPIYLVVARISDWTTVRSFKMTYFKGKITEFSKEK